MRSLKIITFFASFLIWMSVAQASSVQISSKLAKNQVSLGEEVTLVVSVMGNINPSTPIAPKVAGLTIHQSGRSSQVQFTNGKMSIAAEFMFSVVADRAGSFKIPSFHVFVGGRDYRSNDLTLSVVESSAHHNQGPSWNQQPQPLANKNQRPSDSDPKFWLSTRVSQGNPFRSQQILYYFKLYTRENITQANPIFPGFDDFLTEVVVADKRGSEVINGRSYATWEKVLAIVPLKSGELKIPSASIEVVYEVIGQRQRRGKRWDPFFNNSFFNGGLRERKKTALKSNGIDLKVKELPAPVPQNFTGLVGDFGLQSSLSDQEINEGDSVTLEIKISGSGNIKEAQLPKITVDGFKIYTDKPISETMKSERGVSGQKVFKMALVAERDGNFTLPEIKLSYFNPKLGEYKTMVVEAQHLKVLPAEEQKTNSVLLNQGQNFGKSVSYQDIAPIFPDGRQVLASSQFELPDMVFYTLVFGMPMGFLVVLIGKRIRVGTFRRGGKNKKKVVYKHLMDTLSSGGVTEDQILDSVRNYLSTAFKVPGQALTAQEMESVCVQNKVSPEVSKRLFAAVQNLEAVQYGLDKEAALGAVAKELKKVLGEVNKVA